MGDPKQPRPWFKKKRFILPIGGVALIWIISALGGGDTPATPAADVTTVSSSPKAAVSAPPSAAASSTSSTTPTSSTTSTVAPPPAKPASQIGKKVRDGKFEFTVRSVKCGIAQVGDQYLNTKAQGQFCAVAVTVANIGDKAQTMFADNQKAFDGKDREFSASSEASLYDNSSQVLWEDINPGNSVRGTVYFDVPKGTTLVKLELHDSAFSGGVDVRLG